MKKILALIIMMLSLRPMFSDVSDDDKNIMKFRGYVQVGAGYYFDIWQGDQNDHLADFLYRKKDLTNSGDPGNISHNDNAGRSLGGWGGCEMGLFTQWSMIAPFLKTPHFLFSGNNIKVNLNAKINPVAIGMGIDFVLTPVAFYYFNFSFSINGGWGLQGLGNGLTRNIEGIPENCNFNGPLIEIALENVLQFDTSYLVPEKIRRWMHILFFASAVFKYKALASISENEPFFYENDNGENLNGWKFYSTFIVGYKIPVIEDDTGEDQMFLAFNNNNFAITLAMMTLIEPLELTHYNDSPMAKKGWGSDFIVVKFGPVINFDLPRNFFLIFQVQFANDKRYEAGTYGNMFYQNRIYEDYYIYFRRIALMFGWKISK